MNYYKIDSRVPQLRARNKSVASHPYAALLCVLSPNVQPIFYLSWKYYFCICIGLSPKCALLLWLIFKMYISFKSL